MVITNLVVYFATFMRFRCAHGIRKIYNQIGLILRTLSQAAFGVVKQLIWGNNPVLRFFPNQKQLVRRQKRLIYKFLACSLYVVLKDWFSSVFKVLFKYALAINFARSIKGSSSWSLVPNSIVWTSS